jgi:hypothetical protein
VTCFFFFRRLFDFVTVEGMDLIKSTFSVSPELVFKKIDGIFVNSFFNFGRKWGEEDGEKAAVEVIDKGDDKEEHFSAESDDEEVDTVIAGIQGIRDELEEEESKVVQEEEEVAEDDNIICSNRCDENKEMNTSR